MSLRVDFLWFNFSRDFISCLGWEGESIEYAKCRVGSWGLLAASGLPLPSTWCLIFLNSSQVLEGELASLLLHLLLYALMFDLSLFFFFKVIHPSVFTFWLYMEFLFLILSCFILERGLRGEKGHIDSENPPKIFIQMFNVSLGIGLKSKNIDGKWKSYQRQLDSVLKVNIKERIPDNLSVKWDWRRGEKYHLQSTL